MGNFSKWNFFAGSLVSQELQNEVQKDNANFEAELNYF